MDLSILIQQKIFVYILVDLLNCFFGDELLEFLLDSITIEDTLKLDPGHTFLEGFRSFILIPDSLGVWQKNFLLLVITGKSYDFCDPKSLIHICIPMTSEKWIGLIGMFRLSCPKRCILVISVSLTPLIMMYWWEIPSAF